mgnify:CR=1 FL=1
MTDKKELQAKYKEKAFAYALKNAIEHEGKAKQNKVLNSLFEEGLEKKDIKTVMPVIKEQVKKVNSYSSEKQKFWYDNEKKNIHEREEREGLRELPRADSYDKIVLRLAPFPSGALHIGNMKTLLLNALYQEKYDGKLRLIIDDTIGSEEKPIVEEAYDLIPEAFKWLDVDYSYPIVYKSDRLEIYYRYAKKLIKKGKAYVCECSQEVLRENRKKGIECSCRQHPSEEQMKRWKKMFKSSTNPGDYTLRIKTNMKDKDPAFRDRVLFRIVDREHPRIGKKYRVWPMLEFSWAIDDHKLNMTHIIRGKDLKIESRMERFIWDCFGWEHPEIIHTGMVKLEGVDAKISKSKAQKEVKSGKFIGSDDPRTWSVQSLRKRGFDPKAIRKFVENLGSSNKDITIPVEKLYATNRKEIDARADRYSFLPSPKKLPIKDRPSVEEIEVKIHPEKGEKRKKSAKSPIYVSKKDLEKFKGEEVRLMELFNVKIEEEAEFMDNESRDLPTIQWASNFVEARVLMPNGEWETGAAEKAIENLDEGEVIQFKRFGFCRYNGKNEAGEHEFWFAHQ